MSDSNIADHIINYALKGGADQADVMIGRADSIEVTQRLGKREAILRSETIDIGVRVIIGRRQAMVSSSDEDKKTLEELTDQAIAMARVVPEDPWCGLEGEYETLPTDKDLDLCDSHKFSAEELLEMAARTEEAALANKDITNSEGADAHASIGQSFYATSTGFSGEKRGTNCGVSIPKGHVHQGLVIDIANEEEVFLSDIIIKSKIQDKTLLVMLDQVTDPHNIGAILRSAAAFGATAMIGQTRHMPDVTPVMAKIACGAVEHVPIVREKNLSEALESLKAEGFTCIGLDEHTDKELADIPKSNKTVIVLGAEGSGLRPKVADTCTHIAKLPTQPPIASLNVSNAAAIALYELA